MAEIQKRAKRRNPLGVGSVLRIWAGMGGNLDVMTHFDMMVYHKTVCQ